MEGNAPIIQAPSNKLKMEAMIIQKQNEICDWLERVDGTKMIIDKYDRPSGGGYGITRVMQGGNVFEKAGCNISVVHGVLPPAAVKQMASRGKDVPSNPQFYACGISLVFHPHNPNAPTVHANYRYFEVESNEIDADGNKKIISWFGGGADLTPTYLVKEEAMHFHQVHKTALKPHGRSIYKTFKKWCDEYFYIPHRKECRGVGGIFFDDLDVYSTIIEGEPVADVFQLVQSAASAFLPAYTPILEKTKDLPYTEEMKRWQQLRRGRYVEFNLVHDRGTKFGLAAPDARIESILMSLPLTSRWEYDFHPEPNTKEDEILKVLQTPVDWIPLM